MAVINVQRPCRLPECAKCWSKCLRTNKAGIHSPNSLSFTWQLWKRSFYPQGLPVCEMFPCVLLIRPLADADYAQRCKLGQLVLLSEFYSNSLVVSDVLCSSTQCCIPMKILCELLCINHHVSPWQDRILQQATFRSWCWALPTSSEFNLHCKVVVDCGHHAGYELQENKECLPKVQ